VYIEPLKEGGEKGATDELNPVEPGVVGTNADAFGVNEGAAAADEGRNDGTKAEAVALSFDGAEDLSTVVEGTEEDSDIFRS
jgi:hypothetical protein